LCKTFAGLFVRKLSAEFTTQAKLSETKHSLCFSGDQLRECGVNVQRFGDSLLHDQESTSHQFLMVVAGRGSETLDTGSFLTGLITRENFTDFSNRENVTDFSNRENFTDFSDRENFTDFSDRENFTDFSHRENFKCYEVKQNFLISSRVNVK
jgi:hypothetical protein